MRSGLSIIRISIVISILGEPPMNDRKVTRSYNRKKDFTGQSFQIAAESDEMMAEAEPFDMDEEPYFFEFDSFLETVLLMTFKLEGQTYPAAWAHEYGLGRVVYLMPGHHLQSFKHAGYQKLIVGGANWASR
jgi:type 1 glutamine amidotransferase